MSLTHTIARTYNDAISNIGGTESVTADTGIAFDGSIAGTPTTNVQVNVTFTRANLKSICLYSDKALTIYTNDDSGGSPDDTIPLAAGRALVWSLAHDTLANCPFTEDVTALYVTVGGAAAATLKIRVLTDQTP